MSYSPLVIATHNGAFHADDIFGCAVLMLLHPKAQLIRTRDPQLIAKADFAVDVGGVYDAAAGRFDHHQKGFAEKRPNGTTFASAGLVWMPCGRQLIHRLKPELQEADVIRLRDIIDVELVQHLDRADTGEAQGAPGYFGLSALLASFNSTRVEEQALRDEGKPADVTGYMLAVAKENQFREAVKFVQALILRLIEQYASQFEDEAIVRAAERLEDGRILVLDVPSVTWDTVVCPEMPDVLFVVYPDSTDNQFQVRTVPVAPQSFTARMDLPQAWAGLRDADLAKVTGVADSVFCHNGRFIGGAKTKEGALALARLALKG